MPIFHADDEIEDGGWLHPSRLPLGAGWNGQCSASGHEGDEPAVEELREFCNLGYALRCPRLPQQRSCDAVRFAVARDLGSRLSIGYVTESAHRPVSHGSLEFDVVEKRWTSLHDDAKLQKMAECYVESYLLRRIRPAAAGLTESANYE